MPLSTSQTVRRGLALPLFSLYNGSDHKKEGSLLEKLQNYDMRLCCILVYFVSEETGLCSSSTIDVSVYCCANGVWYHKTLSYQALLCLCWKCFSVISS